MKDNIPSDNSDFIQLKKSLQIFQLDRIKNTYSDFSNSQQFNQLTSFFFKQIYGPQDFGFRNDSIKTLYHKSHLFLRQDIIKAVEGVLELNELSDELDEIMVNQLISMGEISDISFENYGKAYKNCNNYDRRCSQIDLMVHTTKRVFELSHIWLIGASLSALHSFAEILGMAKIMNFLYDGYQAFHKVDDITTFVDAVYQRESELNERLFGK